MSLIPPQDYFSIALTWGKGNIKKKKKKTEEKKHSFFIF